VKFDMQNTVAGANRWREQYNPLRSLTLARAVSMLENAQRGIFPELQWTYSFIERRDPDLRTLVERRASALMEMEWQVKAVSQKRYGASFDQGLADAQQAFLTSRYNAVANFYDAIEHFALASWRGFSLLQDQDTHFELLDSWNFCRDGLYGDWYWNPEARDVPVTSLPPANRLDLAKLNMLCLENRRPINEIALVKYVRQSLSEKDWDAFVEVYGLPGWLIIEPPNLPTTERTKFRDAAEDLSQGASGTLPNGSTAQCADQPRGIQPFQSRLEWLTQKLVLAGTGGLLTMLTAPGSGTLAGSAHMEAFRILAAGEARRISELFQKQRDARMLAAEFPGKPVLAYFELCAKESNDVKGIIDDAVKLKAAGYSVDMEQLQEKTGYTLEVNAMPELPPTEPVQPAQPAPEAPAVPAPETAAADLSAEATAELENRIAYVAGIEDPDFRRNAAQNLLNELPKLAARKTTLGTAGLPLPALANAVPASAPGAASFFADKLAAELGVPASWMAPVQSLLAELEAKATDKTMTDADFAAFLSDAVVRVPELFAGMDVEALADVMERAAGAAVIEGARAGMKKGAK
jgi:phage gp29-like protein